MVEPILAPAHANPLEALLDEPFAGALYQAAANRQSQCLEAGVVDMVTMGVEVIIQVLQGLTDGIWQTFQGQCGLGVCQHLVGFAPAQLSARLGKPLTRSLGAPVQPSFGSLPQVLGRVVEVQDTLRVLLKAVTEQPPEAPPPITQPDNCLGAQNPLARRFEPQPVRQSCHHNPVSKTP